MKGRHFQMKIVRQGIRTLPETQNKLLLPDLKINIEEDKSDNLSLERSNSDFGSEYDDERLRK